MKKLFNILFLSFIAINVSAQTVSRYAGVAASSGSVDGSALSAKFNSPHGICADKTGNVFVADRYNNKIRKITLLGVVTTFAGSGAVGANDGTGTAATFNEPWAIACDTNNNLYVADTKSYKIRKITSAGVVTTVAGTGSFGTTNGAVNVAQFGFPAGIAVSKDGSIIYVADRMTHIIRKIQGGQVSTIAGTAYLSGSTDGTGSLARFDHPYNICLDNSGNVIVADSWNFKIRKVTPTGAVTTVAGSGVQGSANGPALSATFDSTWAVVVDSTGNIYVGDGRNYTIRKITPTGIVSKYAGKTGIAGYTDGDTSVATFNGVTSLAYYKPLKCLFAGDSYNQLIRKISPLSTTVVTVTTNSSNNTFCLGASVTLTAAPSGLTSYTFKDGTTILGISATPSFTTTALSLGVHSITCTAIDLAGLPVTSNPINVNIVSSVPATISPAGPISICQGDSILLAASGGIAYHWSTGAVSQNIYAKNAGSYMVTVTSSGGCTAQSPPVSVTLKPFPTSVQTANDTVCPLEQGQITTVPQAGVSYYWYEQPTGGSLLSIGTTFTAPGVSQTTPYFIELHGSNGCMNPNRAAAYIIVDQAPSVSFQVSLPSIVPNGIQVYFYNSTSGGIQYQWNFGDPLSSDDNSSLENPTHIYAEPGDYNVTLVSTNQKGCADSLLKLIHVEHNLSIFIPTTFTPNNDGNNDIFRVRGSNIKTVSMNIFNQWGQKIYMSEKNEWDGTMRGDLVQNGTYSYFIDVMYNNETSEKFKGQITVIR
ncbi:MAG TPA: gliding motility-associated C-terminal domain-containing protein [Bacteroidia bacterium]|nr:gliding motility-associated C-terminal domain-containing protein [Bacteroidia bacterium]